MRIGELAIAAQSDVDTIRYYEKIGILHKPARTEGNYRYYNEAHVDRLRFVRHCRALDMTLDEVRLLLQFRDVPESDCAGVNQLLDEHIGHVTERIEALTLLEKELRRLRRQCRKAQKAKDCGILVEIGNDAALVGRKAAKRHVAGTH
jgi:Cd(II)/Pb(II)-responsive transcriptional regulator